MLPIITGIITSLISNNLPKLAQAVTEKGLDYVQDKLGVELKPDMSAENIAQLKTAAFKHEEFKEEQSNKNTSDARSMNARIQESGSASYVSKNAAYILDLLVVSAAIIVSWLAFFQGVPAENKELVYMALGSLWTLTGTIINFHRGSSKGSQSKDELISKLYK